jgi:hypothetical protein
MAHNVSTVSEVPMALVQLMGATTGGCGAWQVVMGRAVSSWTMGQDGNANTWVQFLGIFFLN